ncbi:DUF4230 domain-containing protein [Sphingomonas sp. So64.6b]|uniref:DUF4230 domain-containing protein n=1 Tax=Sphingomonas sp. So64.6b TaxID=2997354 RepID=UPI0016035197|nr:DUF4230 domain-containing protein [Sphingomonas sp. So64.6b]QNA84631.1 DUF4230 domain-containing protein [Sphingomonas sp. So64.6b]
MDNKRIVQVALAIAVIIAALVGGWMAWDRYTERYAISREEDGTAITKIVSAKFSGASAIKVGALSGTVQASASDTRGFGMLTSDKVIKAPFSIDYFVDMSRLSADAYEWDAARRTLTIRAPDVVPAAPNIDWSAQTADRTRGLFVTRDAADQLMRRATLNAKTVAQKEGVKPEHLMVARENARRALTAIAAGPLKATGMDDVRVVVSFPFDRRGPSEQMDRSRSLREVLGNQR